MDESQEALCAGTGSVAVGGGRVSLKPFGKQLNLTSFHTVPMSTAAHIHSAPVCTDGGVVFTLSTASSPYTDTWYLPSSAVIDFLKKGLYLNIHSTPFSAGEIRGQFIECCANGRGDLNLDGTNTNILDLTYAVDRIFRGGQPAPCLDEGDVDSDGTPINILDLTFIVDRIFRSGPPGGPCPL
jgi:hypothetical protein